MKTETEKTNLKDRIVGDDEEGKTRGHEDVAVKKEQSDSETTATDNDKTFP